MSAISTPADPLGSAFGQEPAELIDPLRPEEYARRMRPAAWVELPPNLRSHFDSKGPLYLTVDDITLRWRNFRFEFHAGMFFDFSSIPLALRFAGISRWSPTLSLVPASLVHDAWWRGLVGEEIVGRKGKAYALLGNQAYREIGTASGHPAWKMAVQAGTLGLVAWLAYGRPRTKPNPEILTVVRLG